MILVKISFWWVLIINFIESTGFPNPIALAVFVFLIARIVFIATSKESLFSGGLNFLNSKTFGQLLWCIEFVFVSFAKHQDQLYSVIEGTSGA